MPESYINKTVPMGAHRVGWGRRTAGNVDVRGDQVDGPNLPRHHTKAATQPLSSECGTHRTISGLGFQAKAVKTFYLFHDRSVADAPVTKKMMWSHSERYFLRDPLWFQTVLFICLNMYYKSPDSGERQ